MSTALTELLDKWRSQYIHQKTAPLGGHGVHHSDPFMRSSWDESNVHTITPLQHWLWGPPSPGYSQPITKTTEPLLKLVKQLPSDGPSAFRPRLLPFNCILLPPPSPFIGARPALVWRLQTYSCSLFPLSFSKFLGCLLPSGCLLLTWTKLTIFQDWKKIALWWAIKGECFLWQIPEPRRETSPSF